MARTIGTPGGTPERPAVFFRDAAEFRAWLERNHDSATELWMGLRKRHVADRGLTWVEAVPEALCFGWIDSLSQPIDDDSRRQRWTPRKAGSTWSLVNVAHVERLLAEGRMHPAGIAAFEARQPDRTGTYSFEQTELELEPTLQATIDADAAASAFWQAATPTYRRTTTHWIMSAKREDTRARRTAQLVDASRAGIITGPAAGAGATPRWVERAATAAREAAS